MKKFILGVFFLGFLFLALTAPLAAQESDNPSFVFDETVVAAILGLFGIGLVYIVNGLKSLLKLQGKAAVALTIVVSLAATAGVLLVSHTFGILPFIVYSAAVVGEMTGWYKFTKPARA
jgi:hypothetical protein